MQASRIALLVSPETEEKSFNSWSRLSFYTVSQDSSHQKSTAEQSNPCLQKTLWNLMMAQPSCCVALWPCNPSTRAIPLPRLLPQPSSLPKIKKIIKMDPSPQLSRVQRFMGGILDLTQCNQEHCAQPLFLLNLEELPVPTHAGIKWMWGEILYDLGSF